MHNDITWVLMHLRLPAIVCSTECVQANNKENIKPLHHWLFVRWICKWPVDSSDQDPFIWNSSSMSRSQHVHLTLFYFICVLNEIHSQQVMRYRKIANEENTEHLTIAWHWSGIFLILSRGWVGLWGFLWWAPSAKREDHHGVSSGWSSVWHCSNTGLSSTQYEQIPIILGVWPFWLTPFFFGQ